MDAGSAGQTCSMCALELDSRATRCPRCGQQVWASGPAAPAADLTGAVTPPEVPAPGIPTPGRTVQRSQLPVAQPAPIAPESPFPPAGVATPSATTGPSAGSPTSTVAPVDLGTRFLANLVDSVFLFVVFMVLAIVITVLSQVSNVLGLLGQLVFMLIGLGYYALGIGRGGATIGKRIMGVSVVDVGSHQPIGVGRALGRYIGLGLMALPCYLGYISFFTDKSGYNRAFHDQIVSSVAIAAPKESFGQAARHYLDAVRGG